ncbi:protein kinase domain protein [Ichthyophthirius multifiliis]|uniref:Protein kinase domain protein n=1 Tax=Ichthyophthirius multifiliis TaxID=5932 RepID=G0R3W9_ICHMU|nr:protein kinase domain protein [Ichthyophthirius multifiliis]EGR27845.1 protein kinase domain protein [Ichthyophthirius multifiliis]|eukprot:XP_004027190.1 protein kinase domain protein [Ichthyophthirius multifiliis]
MKAKHKFTIDETRYMIKGLLEGLAYMHSKNIMHRDLKPENLIFKNNSSIDLVIADLGLGTRTDVNKFMFVRCGTPGFVAPEVINITDFDLKYDSVCDLFSLGLIFHILLVGKSPFNGKTYEEILAQNRASNIILEGTGYLKLPLEAYDLLKKMLINDPKKRITAKKALQHPFFQEGKQESQEGENLTEQDKINKLDIRQKMQIANSPMPSPQIIPTKGKKIVKDEQGPFKMPNTPVLTGRTDQVSNEGGFNSPSIQIDQRQIKTMEKCSQAAKASLFSPKITFGNKNISKMNEQIQEQEEDERKVDNKGYNADNCQICEKSLSILMNYNGIKIVKFPKNGEIQ